MRIKKITDRLGHRGQDLYGVIECEHCGAEEKFTGYRKGQTADDKKCPYKHCPPYGCPLCRVRPVNDAQPKP